MDISFIHLNFNFNLLFHLFIIFRIINIVVVSTTPCDTYNLAVDTSEYTASTLNASTFNVTMNKTKCTINSDISTQKFKKTFPNIYENSKIICESFNRIMMKFHPVFKDAVEEAEKMAESRNVSRERLLENVRFEVTGCNFLKSHQKNFKKDNDTVAVCERYGEILRLYRVVLD